MGKVFKLEDVVKRKKILDKALSDLNPEIRNIVSEILENYKGEELRSKLKELIGNKKASSLLKAYKKI
jgi:tRNA-binding EMAP/Myf-like protein